MVATTTAVYTNAVTKLGEIMGFNHEVTQEVLDNIIKMLEGGCTITAACRANKISRVTFYRHKNINPDFKARVDACDEEINDRLEKTMVRLALDEAYYPAIRFLMETRIRDRYGKVEKRENYNENRHSGEINVTEKRFNERLAKYERYFEELENQG
jgi:hypothetical protein